MAQLTHVTLPDVGEGLTEAEITTWRVAPGDTVAVNQVVVEIETAKAAVELPSPHNGVVTELLAEPGTTVQVGAPIMTVDLTTGTPADEQTEQVPTLVGYGPGASRRTRRPRKPPRETPAAATVPQAKPPVRKLAKDLGIDLHTVSGSGPGGLITREDVQRADDSSGDGAPAAPEGQRRVPVRGVRRATAQAMSESAFTAPHVTEFLTVDVTPMTQLRRRLQAHREFREAAPTPLAFAVKAACLAIKRTPEINASWDEATGEIVYYEHVHLGIAAATPRGLLVPKIRHAQSKSLTEIATALETLSITAREGATPPADLTGGTFTITNIGVFGVDTGTPILNPGESGILALGTIREMPWVVDDAVVPRDVCQLALSFDHRVADGQQGSRFLADVGALLADPALALTY